MSFANVSVRPKNIVEFVMSVDKDDIMSDDITIGISYEGILPQKQKLTAAFAPNFFSISSS